VSLGLSIPPLSGSSSYGSNSYSPYLPPPVHKSAGLAFALSLLVPGVGQFYCGKIGRGGMTLAGWLVGLICCFTGSRLLIGLGITIMFVLWVFSFVDAYFTAIEVSQGNDEIVDDQNPRVAVVMNLLTAGLGYFYLGERAKGIAMFAAIQVARFAIIPKVSGIAGSVISIVLLLAQFAMAADAYRIAERQLKEALGPAPQATSAQATSAQMTTEQLQIPLGAEFQVPASGPLQGSPAQAPPLQSSPSPPVSRLPKEVPLALAGLMTFGFIVLAIIGTILGPAFSQKRRAATRFKPRQYAVAPQPAVPRSDLSPVPVEDSLPIHAVDLGTAVLDVRRVQRKSLHTKDDIPNLTRDVQVLSSTVDASKTITVDVILARFNRAIALALINMAHEQEGEPMDASVARRARSDLDKIINGPSLVSSPTGVTLDNSEYWAGYIARNQMHDEKAAYAYWEKCASDTHAGCISNLAEAHITGDGGQKVDVRQALDLLTTVYNSGLKYNCAGALSALNIAETNYFTGVRRPGDDELEWLGKSDVLWDKLASGRNDRNVCLRGENEIEEFLLQLSKGHRDDNILQDALSRLDDGATAPKAVIQYMSGAIDEPALLAQVQADKSQDLRCYAYFEVAWYSKLHNENAMARRYYQRMAEIGKFHCGVDLVFAGKLIPPS
jgi:TM2 domain-containing membrane protein YozV